MEGSDRMYLIKAELGTFVQYFDATGTIENINSWNEPYESKAEAKNGIKWMKEHDWLNLKDYKKVKFNVISLGE